MKPFKKPECKNVQFSTISGIQMSGIWILTVVWYWNGYFIGISTVLNTPSVAQGSRYVSNRSMIGHQITL